MQTSLDFTISTINKEEGIKRAVEHADKESPGWSERAFNLFVDWVQNQKPGKEFKTEDIRIHCKLLGLIEDAPSGRAWGAIAVKVAKAGKIKKIGYTTTVNPKAHCTPCTLWAKS